MRQAQWWITAGRFYQACRGLGVAKRCLDLAVSYAKQRVTFGAPLADRQAVQFMIADSFTEHHMTQVVSAPRRARRYADFIGVSARRCSLNPVLGSSWGAAPLTRSCQLGLA